MKNIAQKKRHITKTSKYFSLRSPKNYALTILKCKFRQLLSVVFIYSLVVVPLLSFDSALPHVQGQAICGDSADKFFQNCGLGQYGTDLTDQAINDVIEFYKLPPTSESRNLVFKYARNEMRSMAYARFLTTLKKQSPTPDEESGINAFLAVMKAKRFEATRNAVSEYNSWEQTGCTTYRPPAPYTYEIPGGCNHLAGLFSPPKPPSFEEFQAFGVTRAYGDLFTPEAQDVSQKTTAGIAVGVGAGSAVLGGVAAYAAGTAVTFGTLSAILPYAGIAISPLSGSFVFPAATASSGTIGGTAAAGPAAIIIVAVLAAVMEGIAVSNASQLPDKLLEAQSKAQNQNLSRFDFTYDDASNQEIYGTFLRTTLPEFAGAGAPAPTASDLGFTTRTDGASGTSDSSTITYVDWDGAPHTARLSGGWFADKKNTDNDALLQLSIRYVDWNGDKRIASRNGASFLLTTPGNVNASEKTSELTYKDGSSLNRGAIIKFQQLTAIYFSNISMDSHQTNAQAVTIGTILERSQPAANMAGTVNGAASATVNGVTLSNVAVNSDYQITASATVQAGSPVPQAVNFTVVINNGYSQTEPAIVSIKKSAILDNLPFAQNLTTGTVGQSYQTPIFRSVPNANYYSDCTATISGELPPGVILKFDSDFSVRNCFGFLSGTPLSGGNYIFTINKNYDDGEVLSRTYTIAIKSDIAELPANLVSWWRAEKDAEDFTNAHKGTQVGTIRYTNGKANSGWLFNGSNSYIALPTDTFNQTGDYSFELWFKTNSKGVILGRQSADKNPYDTQLFGATPMIYVHQDGKLRVRMFSSTNPLTSSPNRVDDGNSHHVAVVYTKNNNSRTVYLDGAAIGTTTNDSRSYSNYDKFQFGTGYVNEGTAGGMNGWFNFNGVIDEATLYNRAITPNEIQAIYTAGGAGKMSVDTTVTPPFVRDGSDGSITITATGGTPALQYSIDNGATFKYTSFFPNLTPGTYSVVVKDGANHPVRRTVVINNPPPSLNLTTRVIPPKCYGGGGRIQITATGTTGEIEYSILEGANRQSSGDFTEVPAGRTYKPWIRDVSTDTVLNGESVFVSQPSQIVISPSNFVNAALNVPYSRTFTASGGTGQLIVSVLDYTLPAGLSATSSGNSITISGTPTQTGTFPIYISITDQNSCPQGYNVPLTVTSNQTFGIGGKVTNGGQGLANVTITLAGAENRTTTTDAAGNYSFATIAGSANYALTATLNGATFAQPTLTFDNLSANFTDANFATAATTYEGDIAPRRGGDSAVNVLDLVALGRILMPNNPDAAPEIGAEFQRADIAPRNNSGNGVIDANDSTQLRNYILGTNPKTPAGGAIAPASSAVSQAQANEESFFKTPKFDLRNLKANLSNADAATDAATVSADTVTYGNQNIQVPIRLNSNGNVAAAQFTVNYDASKLNYVSITNAAGAPANTLVYLDSGVPAGGKLAFIVQQPSNGAAVFPSGNVPLLTLNFTRSQNATGFARIDFGGAPTQLIASDVQANAVALNSTPGGVSITAAPGISGKVMNGGQGLSNVTVSRTSNGQTVSTMTDASGNYYFDNLTNGGNYTIQPALNGYTFTPATLAYTNLNASFTNADFNTSQTSYEGDIAGRPTGDGTINASDVTTLGNIIANLDAKPADGAEWQRADVAPKVSFGDGAVDVRDLVQLGLYAALNTKVPANGAITAANPIQSLIAVSSQNDGKDSYVSSLFNERRSAKTKSESDLQSPQSSAAQGTATVKAVSATANGSNAIVPIQLTSSGDAAAIQFTVNYDAAKLSIPSEAAITARYPNTNFVINNNTAGKLVIVAYQPLDGSSVFPTGDIELFRINFAVANTATGIASITFGDSPAPTGATAQSERIQVSNTSGFVRISGATAAGVTIKGRVKSTNGRGLVNATIFLTSESGTKRTTRTGLAGSYSFENVAPGRTYIVKVASKRYAFDSKVFSFNEDTSDVDFIAQPK